jgi:Zinc-binding dehydrogenase/Domain of unknown function (DUF1998)
MVSENSCRERERPEYVMVHSLAHALMSEVALDCGYPASSLKERLYVLPRVAGQPIQCGILIYTATAGNQGTLGGLVEVTRRFVRILKSALERERLCSGDPVCADHDPTTADDDRTLHGAACHGCLLVADFRNLEIVKGQSLLIRGATSSFGQAALKMAINAGVRVIATTRNKDRFAMLEKLGAERCELEGPELSRRLPETKNLDAVLDLVGNSTIIDSLNMLRRGGRACLAGWLGGLAPIADFNPLLQMASGVYLTFFGSFVFGTPGFPLSDVPLQEIAQQVASGLLKAKPSRIFGFEEIREAHRVMEANEAGGKMVVVLG